MARPSRRYHGCEIISSRQAASRLVMDRPLFDAKAVVEGGEVSVVAGVDFGTLSVRISIFDKERVASWVRLRRSIH